MCCCVPWVDNSNVGNPTRGVQLGWTDQNSLRSIMDVSFIGGGSHRPVATVWKTLPYNVLSSRPRHDRDSNSQLITKGVTRSRNSKDMQQEKGQKGQTEIYKTLSLCLKTEQHKPLELRWLTRVPLKGVHFVKHQGSVVEVVIKLIIWLAIITWFIPNPIIS